MKIRDTFMQLISVIHYLRAFLKQNRCLYLLYDVFLTSQCFVTCNYDSNLYDVKHLSRSHRGLLILNLNQSDNYRKFETDSAELRLEERTARSAECCSFSAKFDCPSERRRCFDVFVKRRQQRSASQRRWAARWAALFVPQGTLDFMATSGQARFSNKFSTPRRTVLSLRGKIRQRQAFV